MSNKKDSGPGIPGLEATLASIKRPMSWIKKAGTKLLMTYLVAATTSFAPIPQKDPSNIRSLSYDPGAPASLDVKINSEINFSGSPDNKLPTSNGFIKKINGISIVSASDVEKLLPHYAGKNQLDSIPLNIAKSVDLQDPILGILPSDSVAYIVDDPTTLAQNIASFEKDHLRHLGGDETNWLNTSHYGKVRASSSKPGKTYVHSGADGFSINDSLYAPNDLTIIRNDQKIRDAPSGLVVAGMLPNGRIIQIRHIQEPAPYQIGDVVPAGELLARQGHTGYITKVHADGKVTRRQNAEHTHVESGYPVIGGEVITDPSIIKNYFVQDNAENSSGIVPQISYEDPFPGKNKNPMHVMYASKKEALQAYIGLGHVGKNSSLHKAFLESAK